MSRQPKLNPCYQKGRGEWYLSIPAKLSPTGKRRHEYFPSKSQAEARASVLRKMLKQYASLAAKASPDLVRDAIELNDLAQIHGFSGLREAFLTWAREHQIKHAAMSFAELIAAHEADFSSNWSDGYTSGRWKPFVNLMQSIHETPVSLMDSDFWRGWLKNWREEKSPAPATYNQVLGIVRSLFRHEKARESLSRNPVENLPGLKDVRGEVCVSPPDEVARLLRWCEENDREIIPYFVLGYFAGLRPRPRNFYSVKVSSDFC